MNSGLKAFFLFLGAVFIICGAFLAMSGMGWLGLGIICFGIAIFIIVSKYT
jgi:hypothetical protein